MLKYLFPFFSISFLFLITSCTQTKTEATTSLSSTENGSENQRSFYVANYNIENLFDTKDDPNKIDEWFLPSSEINWTEEKLEHKMVNLARVIKHMNDGKGPDILGVEEVEHEELLLTLITKYIKTSNYEVAYAESPDKRGIDNGLIFNRDIFDLIHSEPLRVNLGKNKTTRDILFVKLRTRNTNEKLNIFVNHWPSRREGLKKSERNRLVAAKTLMKKVNSILEEKSDANIIILGDFNDMPSNISINRILVAEKIECDRTNNSKLYNTTIKLFKEGKGTYKYKNHWNMLDQIIISKSFLDKKGVDYVCNSYEIIKPKFIIQKHGKYKGTSMPTYGGRKYLGGYSDHFPVGAKFNFFE